MLLSLHRDNRRRISRIIVSRDLEKDKGLYFGPYPNVYSARETKTFK